MAGKTWLSGNCPLGYREVDSGICGEMNRWHARSLLPARWVRASVLLLAVRTEMCAATREDDSFDGRFAFVTRQCLSAVDLVTILVLAAVAVGVAVVADGAAALGDGAGEDRLERTRELLNGASIQIAAARQRMDAALVEGFVGINISNAGEEPLIQQRILDRALAGGKGSEELGGGDFQRLRAQAVVDGTLPEPENSAKSSRIGETNLLSRRQKGDPVRVRFKRVVGCGDRQMAGHAQMNVKVVGSVERDENALAPAKNVGDRSLAHDFAEVGDAFDDVRPKVHDPLERLAAQEWPDRGDDRLNFR